MCKCFYIELYLHNPMKLYFRSAEKSQTKTWILTVGIQVLTGINVFFARSPDLYLLFIIQSFIMIYTTFFQTTLFYVQWALTFERVFLPTV